MENNRPVGLSKDAGFQIGARRTLPIALEDAWQLLISKTGVEIWLGSVRELDFTKGEKYALDDGCTGEVRVFSPNSHLRITWQPPDWDRASTIQVRVIPRGEKTMMAFHQEHLPGSKERTERRAHFMAVLDRLEGIIEPA